jgi:hypothetical protein
MLPVINAPFALLRAGLRLDVRLVFPPSHAGLRLVVRLVFLSSRYEKLFKKY